MTDSDAPAEGAMDYFDKCLQCLTEVRPAFVVHFIGM